jgi:preprotein translocase subunit SecA
LTATGRIIEDLRKSVGLRGYGQRDPLNEYKSEAYTFFEQMMGRVRTDVCAGLFTSATNLQSFQSLVAMMRSVRQIGPDSPGGATPVMTAAGRPKPAVSSTVSVALPVGGATATTGTATRQVTLPKIAPPAAPELPKLGRNDMVMVRKGAETQRVKFKKAEQMLKEGWTIVPEKQG